jgi:hypothetical protein
MPSTIVANTNPIILWMPAPQFLNRPAKQEDWVESSPAAKTALRSELPTASEIDGSAV